MNIENKTILNYPEFYTTKSIEENILSEIGLCKHKLVDTWIIKQILGIQI